MIKISTQKSLPKEQTQEKPKESTILALLRFSKSYCVKKSDKIDQVAWVLN